MFANATVSPHYAFVNSSLIISCLLARPYSFIFIAYNATYALLLLPPSVCVVHHGLRQCRRRCSSSSSSSSSSSATMSHSDFLTYHMVVMEMMSVFGCFLGSGGVFQEEPVIVALGVLLYNFTWFGKMSLHTLTCVERHLAVVHPLTYMRLRSARGGVRIRNAAVVGTWLLCFAGVAVMLTTSEGGVLTLCFMVSSLAAIFFCSVSVLRALIRPGPGGARQWADRSKQRAFFTIVVILVVLAVRVFWNMVWTALFLWGGDLGCAFMVCESWFNLPSTLVLPLLYLHRAGKLPPCRRRRC